MAMGLKATVMLKTASHCLVVVALVLQGTALAHQALGYIERAERLLNKVTMLLGTGHQLSVSLFLTAS
jgi:hypothetical protein